MTKPTRSFSQLSSFEECNLSYYYSKIEKVEQKDNIYSHAGTLGHTIFELMDKGEIDNPVEYWTNHFEDYTPQTFFEQQQAVKIYHSCLNFFETFKGWRTKPLGLEEPFNLDFDEFFFRGYIDRYSLQGTDYHIQDYKISNPYVGKDLQKKLKQLYLYSAHIKEKHGKYPKYLTFFFFKTGTYFTETFSLTKFRKAVDWSKKINNLILQATEKNEFNGNKQFFFCNNICSYRENCKAWE